MTTEAKGKIFQVTISNGHDEPVTRLVRAANSAQAFRHVALGMIAVALPSQDTLFFLGASGIKVEEAGASEAT